MGKLGLSVCMCVEEMLGGGTALHVPRMTWSVEVDATSTCVGSNEVDLPYRVSPEGNGLLHSLEHPPSERGTKMMGGFMPCGTVAR
jgi:hypothetical protein